MNHPMSPTKQRTTNKDEEQPSEPSLRVSMTRHSFNGVDHTDEEDESMFYAQETTKEGATFSTIELGGIRKARDAAENRPLLLADDDTRPPPAPRPPSFRRGADVGAFAIAGTRRSRHSFDPDMVSTTSASEITMEEDVLVNAELVVRPTDGSRSIDDTQATSFVVASPIDDDDPSKLSTMDMLLGRREVPRWFRCSVAVFACVFLFLLSGTVIAILQIAGGMNNGGSDEQQQQNEPPLDDDKLTATVEPLPPTISPPPAVTASEEEELFLKPHKARVQALLEAKLSQHTHLKSPPFDNDTTATAQALAYDWIQRDLGSVDKPDARIIQRYALAVFYYETSGGNQWLVNRKWLSEHDECDWAYLDDEDFCNDDGLVTVFDVSGNKLQGMIPNELALLTTLEVLELNDSDWKGSVLPQAMLSSLSHLEKLSISHGGLGGRVPPELRLLTNLHTLYLDGNRLSGTIPSELFSLTLLEFLALSYNYNLRGTISTAIGQLTQLSLLSLEDNFLSGTIPTEIGLLSNALGHLKLAENDFTGTIPTELGNLQDVTTHVVLHYTRLTGTIPTELGSMAFLEVLRLAGNKALEGPIPTEFDALRHLIKLDVSDTKVDPIVPPLVCDALSVDHRKFQLNVPCTGGSPEATLSICNCCTGCSSRTSDHDDDVLGEDDDEYIEGQDDDDYAMGDDDEFGHDLMPPPVTDDLEDPDNETGEDDDDNEE